MMIKLSNGLNFNNNSKFYKCGKIIAKILVKKGYIVLSKCDKEYIFSKTKRLQKTLDSMPFYIKALVKAGVIHG